MIFIVIIFQILTAQALELKEPTFIMSETLSPMNLEGKWLFTNLDQPSFKDKDLNNYDQWTTIQAPGAWPQLNGRKIYTTAWYRASLQFPDSALENEMVLLLDSYISEVDIYIDGQLIFSRGKGYSDQPFYAIQPIPAKFKVTSNTHNVSIRVNTILMRGVYQHPFQVRQSKPYDFRLFFTYMYTDHLKTFAGFLLLIFGVFFALLYFKTKIKIYLMASLLGLGTFPYFGFTHDVFFKAFSHNNILILHYLGILSMALFSNCFCQYLYKPNKKAIVTFSVIQGSLALMFISQVFYFNFEFFQIIRKISFLSSFLIAGQSFFVFYKIHKNKYVQEVNTHYIYYAYFLYLSFAFHDILQALNLFNSIGLLFFGNFIIASTIIWYSIEHFTYIFFTNKKLVQNLRDLTNTLEEKVEARTKELKKSQNQLVTMAHKAGMAEVATNVLHNLGNATNTLSTYTVRIVDTLKDSPASELKKLNHLVFNKYNSAFTKAIEVEPKLSTAPKAYEVVAQGLEDDYKSLNIHCQQLDESVKKITSIISYQKNYTGHSYKEEVNLYSVVTDIIDSQMAIIEKNNIQVKIKLPNPSTIHTEKNKIFHALYNLVDNALEALKDMEGCLEIDSEESNSHVIINLKDNGAGIAPENLKTIFHQGFTTKEQGTGLGLHVTYNSIKELGGQIQVFSDGLGFGAHFQVTLPKQG